MRQPDLPSGCTVDWCAQDCGIEAGISVLYEFQLMLLARVHREIADRVGPNPRCLHASPAVGLRVLLRRALERAGETAPAAVLCGGWTRRGVCFSIHLQPVVSSSSTCSFQAGSQPRHAAETAVSYRVRKLSQREVLEQNGLGSHKLFYFERCLAVSPGKQHCLEQQTLVTCLS